MGARTQFFGGCAPDRFDDFSNLYHPPEAGDLSLHGRVLRPQCSWKVKAMRDDTKETLVSLVTLAALLIAALFTKRDQ